MSHTPRPTQQHSLLGLKSGPSSHHLIGLLVTIVFIATFVRSQEVRADTTDLDQVRACQTKLRTVGVALEMYATDSSGRYPTSVQVLVPRYLPAVPLCPVAGVDTYSASLQIGPQAPHNLGDYQDFYYLACSGEHHRDAGLERDSPFITTIEGVQPDLRYLGTSEEKLAGCRFNLSAIATAAEMYSIDTGSYPESIGLLGPLYLPSMPICPEARKDTYTSGYRAGPGAPGNRQDHTQYYYLECTGNHHPDVERPAYNSILGEIR